MVISSSLSYFNSRLDFERRGCPAAIFFNTAFPFGEKEMFRTKKMIGLCGAFAGIFLMACSARGDDSTLPAVTLLRAPNRGIQPQAVVDRQGTVHMIYFHGEPGHGDISYVRLKKGQESFSSPLRVNSTPGSSIAVGNIRGPQMAIGKNGRVHVAWNGSEQAAKGPHGQSPMLYSRMNDSGTAFEPERNLIHSAYGLDGGGSVAADDAGNVYVAWHAPKPHAQGEENRCVWLTHSSDDGKSFGPERPAISEPTGACGCCGMKAFADGKGSIYFLYRSATDRIHRDMWLLTSNDRGSRFQGEKLHEWEGGICPMSMESFCQSGDTVLSAWETGEQVHFARIDQKTGERSAPISPPGDPKRRKFPVMAANARGQTILAWTEGMGWQKGGSVAWQIFDDKGKPIGETGRAEGVPTWSLVAVFARPDGNFVIVY
jgi:hypothetical protein